LPLNLDSRVVELRVERAVCVAVPVAAVDKAKKEVPRLAPIDVYDSVLMSSNVPLSEKSIAAGAAPVEGPDFTRGKWRTKKPSFGIEG
jgi:hypothetical protein